MSPATVARRLSTAVTLTCLAATLAACAAMIRAQLWTSPPRNQSARSGRD